MEVVRGIKQCSVLSVLTNSHPPLMQMVDDGKLKTTPAVELSYLTPEEQEDFSLLHGIRGLHPVTVTGAETQRGEQGECTYTRKNPAYHVGQAAQRKAARTAAYDSCFGNRAIFPQGIQQ